MKHSRYFITSLSITGPGNLGVVVPTAGGDLIVVERSATEVEIDWELVHSSSEDWPISPDLYDLEMYGPEGEFTGPAALVRSDDRSHVFRGAGTLRGPFLDA